MATRPGSSPLSAGPLPLTPRASRLLVDPLLETLLGLNVSTLRAVISMLSPVWGLRPRREAFRRMRKWPKPTIFTSSLFSKQRKMMSNSDSTTEADCRLDSPWAATALMRSFFVSAVTSPRSG